MLLKLPQYVICSVARFRLRVHTLRFETATWNSNSSPTCDLCKADEMSRMRNMFSERHKGTAQDLCNILQRASVTLHIILLGVGGTIYNTHTLKPFKELGLDSQRVRQLASKLHVHSVNFPAKLVHTRGLQGRDVRVGCVVVVLLL